MHFRTHVKPSMCGISGQGECADGMVERDMTVGKFLDLFDKLGIAEYAFVAHSTDDGVHMKTWPDSAMTPFRNE